MAENSTDKNPFGATEPGKKLPKGVVLGKDGKPCRTCSSGAAFAAFAQGAKKSTSKSATGFTAGALTAASSNSSQLTSECPPDVEALGRSSWTLLHSIAAQYPTKPTPADQSNVASFIGLFSKLYPCWVCAEDFQEYIGRVGGVKAGSREEFGKWLCEAHNDVNKKLGKETFDCGKWEERWRTGWKDGRCD